jgi:hypothetical protein
MRLDKDDILPVCFYYFFIKVYQVRIRSGRISALEYGIFSDIG